MKIDEHRKTIVRALIHGVTKENRFTAMEQIRPAYGSNRKKEQNEHSKGTTQCVITGLFFVDELSEQCVTESNYGSLWMGLWLDCPLVLHDGDNPISCSKVPFPMSYESCHGNTLFPRWLAEVLNECGLKIEETDIYER